MKTVHTGRLRCEAFALILALGVICSCGRNETKPQTLATQPSPQLTKTSQTNPPPVAATEPPQELALRSLSAAAPDIRWDVDSALRADFDFDHVVDEAFLGHSPGKVFVGVVRAASNDPQILEFGVGNAQDAICNEPAKLALESLDYDPTEAVGEIDGFVRSQQSKGLVLTDGNDDCDPIHIYWDHKTQHLSWWRL
jgi:hypothetical protein